MQERVMDRAVPAAVDLSLLQLSPSRLSESSPHQWPMGLRPEWLHTLMTLWRRKQSYSLLLEQATDYTAQEIRHKEMRRACIAWLAAMFVPTRGQGALRRTLTQNIWASYSRNFASYKMAPAFLSFLTLQQPLAWESACWMQDLLHRGAPIRTTALRSHLRSTGIQVTLNSVDAFLRSLYFWGVLDYYRGRYTVLSRHAVIPEIFPLLVWVWWLKHREPAIDLAAFRRSPLFTWIDSTGFDAGWRVQDGRIWTLTQEEGVAVALLHTNDRAGLRRLLLNLLSTEGRKGRQQPRDPELPEEEEADTTDGKDGDAESAGSEEGEENEETNSDEEIPNA